MELRKAAGVCPELENLPIGEGEGLYVGEGLETGKGGGGGGSGKESETGNDVVGLITGGGGGGGEGDERDQKASPSQGNGWEKGAAGLRPNCLWGVDGDMGEVRLEVDEPDEGVI